MIRARTKSTAIISHGTVSISFTVAPKLFLNGLTSGEDFAPETQAMIDAMTPQAPIAMSPAYSIEAPTTIATTLAAMASPKPTQLGTKPEGKDALDMSDLLSNRIRARMCSGSSRPLQEL